MGLVEETDGHEDKTAETLQASADSVSTRAKPTAFPLILQVNISSMPIKNVFTVVPMPFNESAIINKKRRHLVLPNSCFLLPNNKMFTGERL